MYTHPQQGNDNEEVMRLRREAGKWLRELRENAGISQRGLAKAVGLEYYTFISQIESGRGRVPPAQMRAFAEALKIAPSTFAKEMLRFYDPISYALIFSDVSTQRTSEVASVVSEIDQRIDRLRDLLR